MTVYKAEATNRALADVDEAFLWIYDEAPEAALRWYDGLIESFKKLTRMPFRCPLAREDPFFDDDVRQLLYGRYRIIFTVKEKTVFILSVRHEKRDDLTD